MDLSEEFSEGFDEDFEDSPLTYNSFSQDFNYDENESDDIDFQMTRKFCEEEIAKIKNQQPHPTSPTARYNQVLYSLAAMNNILESTRKDMQGIFKIARRLESDVSLIKNILLSSTNVKETLSGVAPLQRLSAVKSSETDLESGTLTSSYCSSNSPEAFFTPLQGHNPKQFSPLGPQPSKRNKNRSCRSRRTTSSNLQSFSENTLPAVAEEKTMTLPTQLNHLKLGKSNNHSPSQTGHQFLPDSMSSTTSSSEGSTSFSTSFKFYTTEILDIYCCFDMFTHLKFAMLQQN